MSQCLAYSTDFLDKLVGLLPATKVAATRGFTPMGDVAEAPFGQPAGEAGDLLWNTVQPVGTSILSRARWMHSQLAPSLRDLKSVLTYIRRHR